MHPWGLAFLPDGSMLVTERQGRLRILRNGKLDPTPISGVPEVRAVSFDGLMDVAVHPRFAETQFVYLTYIKPMENNRGTAALARGRFDGRSLQDVKEIFVAQPNANGTSRIAFGKDGMIYMTIQGASGNRAQDPNDIAGKILRLKDDGTVPDDNPFVGRAGYRPEVFTLGHRSNVGIEVNPETGAIWTTENGPNGGDEINILIAGRNYGWPVVSYGRNYPGPWVSRSAVARVDGTAADFLDAVDCGLGNRVLHRRSSSRRGRATSSSAACGPARSIARDASSASCSTRRATRCGANRS